MPTKRDRVQVLLLPGDFAKFKTLARHNRCTLSKMGALLCEAAMELPQFRKQLEKAAQVLPTPRSSGSNSFASVQA